MCIRDSGKVQEIEKSHSPSVYAPTGRVPEGATGTSGNPSVTQSNTSVNPYDMPNDVEYAVAPRQFGNQTAQELDVLTDGVKKFLRGDQYETVTNREQVQRANDDINAHGIDAVVNDLLARDRWTADDHAAAAVARCV